MIVKNIASTLAGILLTLNSFAQFGQLSLAPGLHLPADTTESQLLVASLEGLLAQSSNANKDNRYVWKDRLPSTSALLDELKRPEHQAVRLDNLAPVDSGRYIVQISCYSTKENIPVLTAGVKLLARKTGDHFSFYSPLEENTQTWKTKKEGSFIFYFRHSLDKELARNYVRMAAEFDRKLKAPAYLTRLYFCDDAPEALEVLGLSYKSAYNGLGHENFSSFEQNQSLMVFGTTSSDQEALDIHDCWHNRLRYAPKPGVVNRFIDEGCAYLYGGAWGYSWAYILNRFKTTMTGQTDWLAVYTENKQFGESQEKHLYAAYVINALLAKKLEKDKGFDALLQFLCSGKKEKDDTGYFAALERLDGINRANFNAVVEKLLQQ